MFSKKSTTIAFGHFQRLNNFQVLLSLKSITLARLYELFNSCGCCSIKAPLHQPSLLLVVMQVVLCLVVGCQHCATVG